MEQKQYKKTKLAKLNLVKIDPAEAIEAVLEKRLAEVDPSRDLVLIKGRSKDKYFRGEQGDKGPIPRHQWIGTSLQFENPDGSFDPPIELKGDKGDRGERGLNGKDGLARMPRCEYSDGQIRWETENGWSAWQYIRGDEGPQGPQGPQGPSGERGPAGPVPEHEREGQLLRFKKPNGEWGDWIDLGTQSFAGFVNPRGAGDGGISLVGSIAAFETKVINELNKTTTSAVFFKTYVSNNDRSLTKMFDLNAVMESDEIDYTVYGKLGNLELVADVIITGPNIQYRITNNESFPVNYRVSQKEF